MALSTRIRNLRYAKGWSPDELARRATIGRATLFQIERGAASRPYASTLRKIARALGVPSESLLEGTPDRKGDGPAAAPPAAAAITVPAPAERWLLSADRQTELIEKVRVLLASPVAETIAGIIEESVWILRVVPPAASPNPPGDTPAHKPECSPRDRTGSNGPV